MTNPSDYDAAPSDVSAAREERRREGRAATFRPDPAMESARELQLTDAIAYENLPASVKIALGYYLAGARAANGDDR